MAGCAGGGSGAAGPSKASEVAVPDKYICSITAEIMTDPVNTVCLAPCRRCARRPSLSVACPRLHTFARLLHVAKQADGFTYERSAIEQWLENLLTLAFPLVVYCSKYSYAERPRALGCFFGLLRDGERRACLPHRRAQLHFGGTCSRQQLRAVLLPTGRPPNRRPASAGSCPRLRYHRRRATSSTA
jgi:hypothetical protein